MLKSSYLHWPRQIFGCLTLLLQGNCANGPVVWPFRMLVLRNQQLAWLANKRTSKQRLARTFLLVLPASSGQVRIHLLPRAPQRIMSSSPPSSSSMLASSRFSLSLFSSGSSASLSRVESRPCLNAFEQLIFVVFSSEGTRGWQFQIVSSSNHASALFAYDITFVKWRSKKRSEHLENRFCSTSVGFILGARGVPLNFPHPAEHNQQLRSSGSSSSSSSKRRRQGQGPRPRPRPQPRQPQPRKRERRRS